MTTFGAAPTGSALSNVGSDRTAAGSGRSDIAAAASGRIDKETKGDVERSGRGRELRALLAEEEADIALLVGKRLAPPAARKENTQIRPGLGQL
jgi:hypothetical protein